MNDLLILKEFYLNKLPHSSWHNKQQVKLSKNIFNEEIRI